MKFEIVAKSGNVQRHIDLLTDYGVEALGYCGINIKQNQFSGKWIISVDKLEDLAFLCSIFSEKVTIYFEKKDYIIEINDS